MERSFVVKNVFLDYVFVFDNEDCVEKLFDETSLFESWIRNFIATVFEVFAS
jgi:hypothetical protein